METIVAFGARIGADRFQYGAEFATDLRDDIGAVVAAGSLIASVKDHRLAVVQDPDVQAALILTTRDGPLRLQ